MRGGKKKAGREERKNFLRRLIQSQSSCVYALIYLLLSSFLPSPSLCQTPAPATIPQGRFLTDSVEIGRPFRYALSFSHPVSEDVLFPDSTAFAPFLIRDKTFLPTRSTAEISTDSAVYTLVSFETQPQSTLRVPLYIVGTVDCTTVFSTTDTVFFRSRLQTARPDTLRLRASTQLMPLRQELNYPVLVAVLGSIALILAVLYALFGRVIDRQFMLFQLRQRHLSFLREYNRIVRTLNPETASEGAYGAVVRWKAYLEQLEQQPFSTMTTPELVERITTRPVALPDIREGAVEEALRTADRMMYGGAYTDQSNEAMRLLRTVAVALYTQRRVLTAQTNVAQTGPSTPETV